MPDKRHSRSLITDTSLHTAASQHARSQYLPVDIIEDPFNNTRTATHSSCSGSSLSKPELIPPRATLRGPSHNSGPDFSASAGTADANFKAGLQLIQQAYDDRCQALVEEVENWKWVAEEQRAQLAAVSAELSRVEENHNALQKEMAQLELFRKAIVSMVDQHSGVALTQLEQSILETIEADIENTDMRSDAAVDADTSSFLLDETRPPAPSEPNALFPHSHQPTREYRITDSAAAATLAPSVLPIYSPSSVARPRASTESAAVATLSTGDQHGLKANTGARRAPALLSPTASPKALANVQKYGSMDNLRGKRNTISTSTSSSSRPVYPSTLLSVSSTNVSKRRSAVSPISPRSKPTQSTSNTRVAPSSKSFSSTGSTPSSSPRQPSSTVAPTLTVTGAGSSRSSRPRQSVRENNVNARHSLSHTTASSISAAREARRDTRNLSADNTGLSTFSRSSRSSRVITGSGPQATSRKLEQGPEFTRRSFSGKDVSTLQSTQPQSIGNFSRYRAPSHSGDEVVGRFHGRDSSQARFRSQETARANRSQRSSDLSSTSSSLTNPTRQLLMEMEAGLRKQREPSQSRPTDIDASNLEPCEISVVHEAENQSADQIFQGVELDSQQEYSQDQTRDQGRDQGQDQGQGSSSGVDASAFTVLYKEIRDSMDASSFGMFARVVTAFNEGEKTTEETLQEVSKIVKDRSLSQRFRDLIHKAIAEKENQAESEGIGNETFENGDFTLEIDQSLLDDDSNDNGIEPPLELGGG